MGVLDFLKTQTLEVIEWTDDSRDTLSFRYPDDDKAIKRGAQLIVRESQMVQFVYLGQYGDTFGPGKHALTTDNIPILTKLAVEECKLEIQGGRERLQQIIDAPVDLFAYPNGKPQRDYDQRHVALVKELGFLAAVSTAAGAASAKDDLFQLPRYTPWGRTSAIWAARLLKNRLQKVSDAA